MERKPQTYANHAKFDELFHFFIAPVGLINLGLSIWHVIKDPSRHNGWSLLFAVAIVVGIFRLRTFPLKAQDRVIRLEERLRLNEVLPEALRPRIGELTEQQLISLRFASNAELTGLVERTLAEKLTPKQIKESIKDWRPDYFRL